MGQNMIQADILLIARNFLAPSGLAKIQRNSLNIRAYNMFNLPIRFTNRKPFGRSVLKLLADSPLYVVIFDFIITALSSLKHTSIASNEIWKSGNWLNFKVSFVYILTPPTFGLEAWLRSILSKASVVKSFAAQWIESQDRWFCLS